jgi:hypothetical protein
VDFGAKTVHQFDLGTGMDILGQNIDLLSTALGALLGCGGTIAVNRYILGKNANYANQSGSKVGRDQVGRDKINK